MNFDSIKQGGLVEIEVRSNGKTMSFRSEISLIINNALLVAPIKVNEQTIGFSDNCKINFLYVSEGKLYIWDNAVITLVRYDSNIYHKIDITGEGKPYNRRASYRMYLGEDMPIYVNAATGPVALSVLVKDISETGVGFITTDDIDVDRTIRLKLKDNSSVINLSGVIVRKEFLEHLGSFLYGCRFTERHPQLGRFIAARQNDMLRKKNGQDTPMNKKPQAQKQSAQAVISK